MTETWSEEGKMKVARGKPGVSVVNLDDDLDYATDCADVKKLGNAFRFISKMFGPKSLVSSKYWQYN